jgi:primosomal protein N' (replication factor Y)
MGRAYEELILPFFDLAPPARCVEELVADVAVPIPVDKTFHYLVPEDLREGISVGKRVLVDIKGRMEIGYVVGILEERREGLRPILDVIDEEPVLNEELISLARWMADYYMCSWGEALHSVAPPGARAVSKRTIQITEFGRVALERGWIRGDLDRRIIELVAESGRIGIPKLMELLGPKGIHAGLARLERDKLIAVRIKSYASSSEERRIRIATLSIPREDVGRAIESLTSSAPKQAKALSLLLNGPMPIRSLEKEGIDRSSIRSLQRKGLVRVELVSSDRSPYSLFFLSGVDVPKPTEEQESAMRFISEAVTRRIPEVFLLHGVTGSGKTEVYMRAIGRALECGRSAIMLVPEISLTPQIVGRFRARFGDMISVFHSRLSEGERISEWRRMKRGEAKIAIGARSAIFAPFDDIGIIVLDEEHESSYKQQEDPKYHARDVAEVRAINHRCPLVLGSATPSIESYHKALSGEYILLKLSSRVDGKRLPRVEVIDMREEISSGNRGIFSRRLKDAIADRLSKGEQVILFLNRRGFASFVLCRECGHVIKCKDCSISLTYHFEDKTLRCHYCGWKMRAPSVCPNCKGYKIRLFGIGTEKVEEELNSLFPDLRSLRMDSDTTARKFSHDRILASFAKGDAEVLIGTQMITKGLDFPDVTLVGVISADITLNLPDFRASERTFQLLTQVAGRAGRGGREGEVIIQTYNPEHYSIRRAVDHDYEGFFQEEVGMRRELGYPPFSHLVNVLIRGDDEAQVERSAELFAEAIMDAIRETGLEIRVAGPCQAPIYRIKGRSSFGGRRRGIRKRCLG